MVTNTNNVLVGAATVLIVAWTSSATDYSDASCTDLGHTSGPSSISASFENYEVKSERAYGFIKVVPVSGDFQIKTPLIEMSMYNLYVAFKMTTNTATSITLSDFQEKYWQLVIKTTGIGPTNIVRRYRFYKVQILSPGELPIAKTAEQKLDLTWKALYDDSFTTGQYGKVVDAAT